MDLPVETPTKTEATTPAKTPVKRPGEVCPRQDWNRIKKFRESSLADHHVMEGYLQELRAGGKYREVFVIQAMANDADLATDLKAFIKARQKDKPEVDALDALALMFSEDLTVKNYNVRFQTNLVIKIVWDFRAPRGASCSSAQNVHLDE